MRINIDSKNRAIHSSRYVFILIATLFSCAQHSEQKEVVWSVVLHRPGKAPLEVTRLPDDFSKEFSVSRRVDGITIDVALQPKAGYALIDATADQEQGFDSVYFSLKAKYDRAIPYNFNGEVRSPEIYRQSPHDVDAWIVTSIAEQAVPVVAIKTDSLFDVALCSSPFLYDNYTSQAFYVNDKIVELSSGDNGESPGVQPDKRKYIELEYNRENGQVFSPGRVLKGYHRIGKGKPHHFQSILFQSAARSQNELRADINRMAATYFSQGKYTGLFGSVAFTTAYMNLRVNDSGKSKYWVVPSVEYSNTQYARDAFWISTMLSPEYDMECLRNELAKVNKFAEYPLFTLIWAYRNWKAGMDIPLDKVQAYLDLVESRVKNGYYHSFDPDAGRLDFQYWGDVMAFEKDDVITFNQGLLALALSAAKQMGLQVNSDPELAAVNYRNMFNKQLGFFPISKKKNSILGPDPLVPDLIAQIYFGEPLLEKETVQQHFNSVVTRSKTPWGYKIVAGPDGNYLADEMYNVRGYVSQVNREKMPDGRYFKGGSYFLYDNLFLLDACLHGVPGAEKELVWRINLDFSIGATTFECLNTKTGEPWKPNMGWNVAVFAFLEKLVSEGKIKKEILESVDLSPNGDVH